MKNSFLSFFILAFISPLQIIADTIGSDALVQKIDIQQTLNNGDRVACLAALNNGFTINSGSTVTFDSIFPVSGNVELNNETIILTSDLFFGNGATVTSFGNIIGNNHAVELSTSTTLLTCPQESNIILDNVTLFLAADTTLEKCNVTISGETTIHGRGNTLILEPSATIIADSDATLLLKNITIKGINGKRIYGTDATSTISLENATWILDNDFTFATGTLSVLGAFTIAGTNDFTFSYESAAQSNIYEHGNLIIKDNITFSYAPSIADKTLINMTANTSKLTLKRATLHTTPIGMILTRGILLVTNNTTIINEGSNNTEAVIFGDGITQDNNLDVQIMPSANLNVGQGFLVYKNI